MEACPASCMLHLPQSLVRMLNTQRVATKRPLSAIRLRPSPRRIMAHSSCALSTVRRYVYLKTPIVGGLLKPSPLSLLLLCDSHTSRPMASTPSASALSQCTARGATSASRRSPPALLLPQSRGRLSTSLLRVRLRTSTSARSPSECVFIVREEIAE